MDIEKAIEILELNIKEAGKHMPPDVKTALELGVEALKREKERRGYAQQFNYLPLPGETDDNGGH